MDDPELIAALRGIRKLIVVYDTIGYSVRNLVDDEELSTHVPKGLVEDLKSTNAKIHTMLQSVENSRRYKDAIQKFCAVKVRE